MTESSDYPGLARRRLARARAQGTPAGPRRPAPARAAFPGRYPRPGRFPYAASAAVAAPHTRPGGTAARRPGVPPPAPATPATEAAPAIPVEAPPESLAAGFGRIRGRQRLAGARRLWRPQPRRRTARRLWNVGATVVPLALLAVLLAVVAPVVYRGARAYQDVFQEPVARDPDEVLSIVPDAPPLLPTAALAGSTRPAVGGTVPTAPTGAAVPTQPAPTQPAAAPEVPTWDGTEPVTILLMGVDTREGDDYSRSDTMILVTVDPVAKTAAVLPIPRDLKLIVPGFGYQKMNAAYAFGEANAVEGGGPTLVMNTIWANLGIWVHHFVTVDFEGFVRGIDELGGLTLDVPYPIKDDAYPSGVGDNYTRLYFQAGWQHMDGERALQYARTRHADGDAARSARQQQVLFAVREKATDLDLLGRAAELITILGDSVRTDLDLAQTVELARLATEIPDANIATHTLMEAVTEDPSGEYFLYPDWSLVTPILSEFAGRPITPPAASLATTGSDVPIRVVNGTTNAGLAQRVADQLALNGFTNVTYAPAADPGQHPTTEIVDTTGRVATVALVAGIVGVSPATIQQRAAVAPPPTEGADPAASADADGARAEPTDRPARRGQIVIVLGDDAPDPAAIPLEVTDEFAVEEYAGEEYAG